MGLIKRSRRALRRYKNAPRRMDKLTRRVDAVEKDVAKLRRRTEALESQVKTLKVGGRETHTLAQEGNQTALHSARAIEFVLSDVILLKRDVGVLADSVTPKADETPTADLR